ncbi:MAG: F0F1 ATP synthase subunit B [Candidatus Bipolaricaulota bacterium]|nr:F0F1 ATP synthase subunit B [Candidatus Bipolaricaulota bacterium]
MGFEWGKVVKTINWTLIFNLINFAILLYLLKRLLFKPALAYLDRRRERIAARMEKAREDEEKAARLTQEREETLKAAYEQSQRTVERARTQEEKIISTAKEDAKKEAERILTAARDQIEKERRSMERDLRRAYAEIAVLGATRVLEREITADDHRRLLDEFIASLEEDTLRAKG